MTKTVLILGASGKIGRACSDAFSNAGWNVRAFNRHKDDMNEAAQGANIIINGLNPPAYRNWAETIPAITRQVIAAARASGATVIVPGNVYNFGAAPGIWSESTPQNAETRKGRIRIEMEQAYHAAAADGVRTIVLRAGNFIDPAASDDVMSLLFMREIAKGKLTLPGAPDVMQAYCYLPDWARAAVALAEKRDAPEPFADIPFPGHSFTAKQLQATLEAELGRKIRMVRFPWWFMTLATPVWKLAYEMREMRYLWNTAHQLSGDKFDRLLPDFASTDLRTVMLAGLPAEVHPDKRVARRAGFAVA